VARRGGKSRGGFRGGRNHGNLVQESNAWSANERGIWNYNPLSRSTTRADRNGSGSTLSVSSRGELYMDVGRIDPHLGNAGGASISFE
jgi:hypothetical protein